MNATFQLILNNWEILFGPAFIILVKLVKNRRSMIAIKYSRTNNDLKEIQSPSINQNQNRIRDILLTEGIYSKSPEDQRKNSAKFGIIYQPNLHLLPNLLKKHKYSKLKVIDHNLQNIIRRLHTPDATSGILLSLILDKNIEPVK